MFPLMTRSALRNAPGTLTYTVRLFSTCDHYGRNKVKSADNEDELHSFLINSPPPKYALLAAHEWRSRSGVGDMVFKAPRRNEYLVVEAKVLKNGISKKWNKVREQANRYGRDWKHKHPSAFVKYATFTNRDGLLTQGELP